MNSIELNINQKKIVSIGDSVLLNDGKEAQIIRIVDAVNKKMLVRDTDTETPRIVTEDMIIEIIVRAVKKTGILTRVANFLNRYF